MLDNNIIVDRRTGTLSRKNTQSYLYFGTLLVKLGKSTNFLFMKRINTGKSHSRHRFHADAVWKQGVSCVSDIHWTHGGVELRKGGTIREKVRNKGMNDRRIKFGKVGYYVYYRKRSFFSSLYVHIYIYSMEGKERKKSNSSLHVSQENRNVQTIHIRFTHDMLFITFMSNPCLGRFPPLMNVVTIVICQI